jgi:tetratricopeptide (TPR) repeat protein
MNKQASILFNVSSSFSGNSAGKIDIALPPSYLQRSIYAVLSRSLYKQEGFELLGKYLTEIIHRAYFARQTVIVEQLSLFMLNLPISVEQKAIAHYYQAICTKRKGDIAGARNLLETSLKSVHPQEQARVLLSLGATYFDNNEIEHSLPHYLEAARAASGCDPTIRLEALREIAIIRSIEGNHYQAISDLEGLLSYYRAISKCHPTLYYELLNSYAIELGEVGRLVEAQNVSAITLASPFAAVYPEFTQTRDELAAKRMAATPSVVAVPALPEVIPSPQAETEPQAARNRSTIALKLGRLCSPTRALTLKKTKSVATGIHVSTILDQLAYSTSPRSPPALL